MEAAQEWNMPPWKVAGGSKTLWFARYEVVREMKIKRADKLRRDAEARRKNR